MNEVCHAIAVNLSGVDSVRCYNLCSMTLLPTYAENSRWAVWKFVANSYGIGNRQIFT